MHDNLVNFGRSSHMVAPLAWPASSSFFSEGGVVVDWGGGVTSRRSATLGATYLPVGVKNLPFTCYFNTLCVRICLEFLVSGILSRTATSRHNIGA